MLTVALLTLLEGIADTATVEHYRCLYAERWGGPLVAAVQPRILLTHQLGVWHEECPEGAAAEWHTHLPRAFNLQGEDRGPAPPWSMCYLSHVDRVTPYDIQIVSVAREVTCAFEKHGTEWITVNFLTVK